MRALSQLAAHVAYDDPARGESFLVRGAVAGLVGAGCAVVPGVLLGHLPVAPLSAAASALLLVLLLPRHPAGLLVFFAGAAGLAALFTPTPLRFLPYFCTSALGVLLAAEREGWGARLVALLGPSLGAAWGLAVADLLTARHLGHLPVAGALGVVALGLFIALGAAASGLSWSADAVTLRLRGEPALQRTWARLREATRCLPPGPDRARLQSLATAAASRWLEARTAAAGVAASLDDDLAARATLALEQLEVRLASTVDAGVADSLRHLARVHRDTLESLDQLRRRKERLDAVAATEAAWLETAAFSVELSPRGTPSLHELTSRLEALAVARA